MPELCREAEECGIAGLQLLKEFITEAEECQLMETCHVIDWECHHGRRTAHFGIRFDYAVSMPPMHERTMT